MNNCCSENMANSKISVDLNDKIESVAQLSQSSQNYEHVYQMSKKPRGYCLILHNFKSDDENKFKFRKGSELDCQALQTIFSKFHFKVKIKENKTALEMRRECLVLSKSEKLESHDAFVLIILSHGGKAGVLGVDGETLNLDTVYKCFNAKQCQHLAGKPKMFFISACRGDKIDSLNDNYLLSNDDVYTGPTWADMLFAYSTIPGYVSIRNELKGTLFGYWLSHHLEQRAHNKPLQKILDLVSQEICKEVAILVKNNQTITDCKQGMEVVNWNFNKDLYFNP